MGGCCINAITSAIIGLILAVLVGTGTIYIIPSVFYGIALVISALLLVIAVIFAVVGLKREEFDERKCLCRFLRCLTTGAIGGIIVSTLALTIIELSVIAVAVFVFLVTFFGLLGLLSLKDIIECIADSTCCR